MELLLADEAFNLWRGMRGNSFVNRKKVRGGVLKGGGSGSNSRN
jgi:hypothetical protein